MLSKRSPRTTSKDRRFQSVEGHKIGVVYGGVGARVKRIENLVLVGVPLMGTLIFPVWSYYHPPGWIEWLSFAILYAVTGIGVGVGLHRYFAHRSFETGRATEFILAIAGSMACQGSLLRWVADHRRHHAYTDAWGDVHSPHIDSANNCIGGLRGFWNSHVGWLFDDSTTDWNIFAGDLQDQKLFIWFQKTRWLWPLLSVLAPGIYGYVLGGWAVAVSCFLLGGCVRITVLHNAIWAVNSIGHTHGEKRFPMKNSSTNNLSLALLTFGEGWHNNHHRFPRSAFCGLTKREIDLNGGVIRFMERMQLAWKIRSAPRP